MRTLGLSSSGQGLAGMGVPAPERMAYVVTLVELVGGALLLVGLLSRFAALLLTIDLIVVILLVKANVGLLSPRRWCRCGARPRPYRGGSGDPTGRVG